MSRAWNNWYHCNGNTYGTWFRGSDLGFRELHHRLHVEGDYKHPPPPGKYRNLRARSERLMHKEPVFLSVEARRAALEGFVGSLTSDRIPVVCAAIDSHHFHVLIKCPPGEARKWVGRAKGRSAMALYRSKLADGKVWTIRFKVTAVKDRAHQTAVANYIVRHASKGAAVWRCDRDGTAKPTD